MDKKVHFVWGNPSYSKSRIRLMRMHGIEKIFIMDRNRHNIVKECEDVAYLPVSYTSFLTIDQPGLVHHFFIYGRKGRK